MKHVIREQGKEKHNAPTCVITEFAPHLDELSMDFAKISGRYPIEGYAVLSINMVAYIINGSGSIYLASGEKAMFNKGDIVYIDKGDEYYWSADCDALLVCCPRWTPQAKKEKI